MRYHDLTEITEIPYTHEKDFRSDTITNHDRLINSGRKYYSYGQFGGVDVIGTTNPDFMDRDGWFSFFYFRLDDQVIGKSYLKLYWFASHPSYVVGQIYLLPDYRGSGLGLQWYQYLLDVKNLVLVSDKVQTANGRKVWQKLASMPQYVVKAIDLVHGTEISDNTEDAYLPFPDVENFDDIPHGERNFVNYRLLAMKK